MHNQFNVINCLTTFILLSVIHSVSAGVDVTYDFENIGNGNSSFVSSGQTFTVSAELVGIDIATFGSDLNGNLGTSDGYLDTGFETSNVGNVGGINAPTGQTFRAQRFDVWPSENQGGVVQSAGALVRVLGFRNGQQIISADVAMFDYGQQTVANVRWHRIDLSATAFGATDIDSVQFELLGNQDYIAVDNFIYSDLQSANNLPTISGSVSNQAVNDDATILAFQNLLLGEPDGEDVALTVTLNNNANGVFTPASLAASGFVGSGPYSLSARTAAQAQTAIRLLAFDPTDDQVAPGQAVTTVFNVASFDGVGTVNDNGTSVVATSIDQAPVAVADAVTVLEDAGATVINVLGNDTDVDDGPIEVSSVNQPSNASVTNNTSSLSYASNADYCNDGNGTDDFTYTLNGGSTASVSMTVTCVNDAPTISVLGDIDATGLLDANNQIQLAGFVDDISFGPDNESGQGVLGFFPNCGSDPNDVIDFIVVDTQGELTIEFTQNLGTAQCTLTMLDNGGTQNNGNNTSNQVNFNVSLTDVIFIDGFDGDEAVLLEIQIKSGAYEALNYDAETGRLNFAAHTLQLRQDLNLSSQQEMITAWMRSLIE
ncbi:Ig-like domain-containing protein [Marinicella sp. S1101]|uniref:Ig-like domain-containing protein n=1 Tax=Marinicella marina TaxID=2996016 RepID=UPI002260A56A|nr:Ig-like domain-containing protein [Marinicella marina]MCX7552553.1 Ig-like domain-containing protein [Marinicella marina]MDJ1139429.1 Ig-like domain-containing protein [Marinicella marina]